MLAEDGRRLVCPLSRRPSLPALEQAVKIISRSDVVLRDRFGEAGALADQGKHQLIGRG